MTGRERLPDRRHNHSRDIEWNGTWWSMTVGWGAGGRVKEIFLKGAKIGTHLAISAEDECFIVSRLLQRGEPISDLARSLLLHRPLPTGDCDTGTIRPSLIALAVSAAAELEQELGEAMSALGGAGEGMAGETNTRGRTDDGTRAPVHDRSNSGDLDGR